MKVGIGGLIALLTVACTLNVDAKQVRFLETILATVGKDLLTSVTKKLSDHLLANLLPDSPYEVILGRTVEVTRSGGSVLIKDVSSGLHFSGQGSTAEEAMEAAVNKMLTTLLNIGIISKHDLHLHEERTTTPPPCGDRYPVYYCENQKNLGMCSPASHFAEFARQNCYKTCTGCV